MHRGTIRTYMQLHQLAQMSMWSSSISSHTASNINIMCIIIHVHVSKRRDTSLNFDSIHAMTMASRPDLPTDSHYFIHKFKQNNHTQKKNNMYTEASYES